MALGGLNEQNQDNNFRASKLNLGLKFKFPYLPTVLNHSYIFYIKSSPSVVKKAFQAILNLQTPNIHLRSGGGTLELKT